MNKTKKISVRITQSEYEKILNHCNLNKISISDFIRININKELIAYE